MAGDKANVALATILCFHFASLCCSVKEPVIEAALKHSQLSGGAFGYFSRHEKHRLLVASGKSLKEDSPLDCGLSCMGHPWCLSYNFQRSFDENRKHLCELLDTDRFNNSKDYKRSDEFDHFGVLSPCSQSPCENEGICVALYDKNDFSCTCNSKYTGKRCEVLRYPATCKEVHDFGGSKQDKAYLLSMNDVTISVFCHMTDISGCGGGGWTLVMKINGSKSTFSYDSAYWSNNNTYNLAGGATGLDNQETKLPSYWNTPFTKLCLGMKVGADTRFILLHQQATSLYSLIADGQYRATSLGRDTWKSLIAGSSLQRNCGREGFNSHPPGGGMKTRIGIIGNQENDCNSPDSFVGFGSSFGAYYCGNYAIYNPDNGDKSIAAVGYVFVK